MQDVRIDETGTQRCWKCGGRNFTEKRTARAKVTVGVGALLTHKKLKCQDCGEYNQTGNAQPFTEPSERTAAQMTHGERAATKMSMKERIAANREAIEAGRRPRSRH